MGASQSTRKLSVDNENAVQLSPEALNRIQAQLTANQQQEQSTPPPQPPTQYAPPPVYYDSQKRQDAAAEEAYWARRIENLKRAHEKINSGMQLEYEKTLKDANKLFDMVQADKIVLECYSANPNKSLLCSVIVNQFNDCHHALVLSIKV
ncbi:unnamed protein product [Leptidea sinapis]|uniref:Uncharacterized protein n=1 Tax=Leptidea sinapis TaxID=189913 RepID=A0A5E4QZ57_9NEOP|nr:unnamed protein product [Leptidea sinapis]